MSRRPLKYFSSWFCPFAHRATIALDHHGISYEWVEALGWIAGKPPSGSEEYDASSRNEWIYHYKAPELLKANPLGMIPTILDPESGKVVTNSINVIQFIDELAEERGMTTASLLPGDVYDRARAREAAEEINKTVTNGYYQALVRTDPMEREKGWETILRGLEKFSSELGGGKCWGGNESLTIVDATLIPYAYRLYVFEHYRGFSLPSPNQSELWANYHSWYSHVTQSHAVKSSCPDRERYLKHVEKYAEGKARSKVGNAVRRGVSAHDYDDDIDHDDVFGDDLVHHIAPLKDSDLKK